MLILLAMLRFGKTCAFIVFNVSTTFSKSIGRILHVCIKLSYYLDALIDDISKTDYFGFC